jgi:hypothetical protein
VLSSQIEGTRSTLSDSLPSRIREQAPLLLGMTEAGIDLEAK